MLINHLNETLTKRQFAYIIKSKIKHVRRPINFLKE